MNVSNSEINVNATADQASGLVGNATDSSILNITNCIASLIINSTQQAAGILGKMLGNVSVIII